MSPSRSRSKAREMPTVPASAMVDPQDAGGDVDGGLGPPRNAKQKTRITTAAKKTVA